MTFKNVIHCLKITFKNVIHCLHLVAKKILAVYLQNVNVTVPFMIQVQKLHRRICLLDIRRCRFVIFKRTHF